MRSRYKNSRTYDCNDLKNTKMHKVSAVRETCCSFYFLPNICPSFSEQHLVRSLQSSKRRGVKKNKLRKLHVSRVAVHGWKLFYFFTLSRRPAISESGNAKQMKTRFRFVSRKRCSRAQEQPRVTRSSGVIRDVKPNRRLRISNEFILFTFRRIMGVRNDCRSRYRVDSGRFYTLVCGPAEGDFCVEDLYRKRTNIYRVVLFRM